MPLSRYFHLLSPVSASGQRHRCTEREADRITIAVFWGALSNGAFSNEWTTWSNISQHALNSVMAFAEIVIPRTLPHPWLNILPIVVLLALYLGLAYLTHSTQHFYVYPFLDP